MARCANNFEFKSVQRQIWTLLHFALLCCIESVCITNSVVSSACSNLSELLRKVRNDKSRMRTMSTTLEAQRVMMTTMAAATAASMLRLSSLPILLCPCALASGRCSCSCCLLKADRSTWARRPVSLGHQANKRS